MSILCREVFYPIIGLNRKFGHSGGKCALNDDNEDDKAMQTAECLTELIQDYAPNYFLLPSAEKTL